MIRPTLDQENASTISSLALIGKPPAMTPRSLDGSDAIFLSLKLQQPEVVHFWGATPAQPSLGEGKMKGYRVKGLSCFLAACLGVKSTERIENSWLKSHQVHCSRSGH